VNFNAAAELPITYSVFVRYWGKIGSFMGLNSVGREVLYSILTDFGILMKLIKGKGKGKPLGKEPLVPVG
jgi:hypothetical protein